jgi:hypothetical protein
MWQELGEFQRNEEWVTILELQEGRDSEEEQI